MKSWVARFCFEWKNSHDFALRVSFHGKRKSSLKSWVVPFYVLKFSLGLEEDDQARPPPHDPVEAFPVDDGRALEVGLVVSPILWCSHMAYLRHKVDPKHVRDTVGKLRLATFQRYTADFQTIRPKTVTVCEYSQVSDSLQALGKG